VIVLNEDTKFFAFDTGFASAFTRGFLLRFGFVSINP
jgi:hypothetical protein